jgi:iron complex transport system permease protein
MRPGFVLALLLPTAAFSLVLALATGTSGANFGDLVHAFDATEDSSLHQIIVNLRFPRALVAFGCGALLALAGALLQALLRNPLADPFVLGISSGAGALTLVAMLAGASTALVTLSGVAGALLSTGLLFILAWRGGLLPTRLLLAGVILSAAWGAVITLLLALAPDAPLRGMVFWLMGDLAQGEMAWPWLPLLGAILALMLAWPLARPLDAIGQGELAAAALGVNVDQLRVAALVLAALLTAGVVIGAGSIGFVGLVTPHLLRLAGLRRHRWLLPGCLVGGGTLLLLADIAARSVAAPLQLPVGAVTALLGAPLFLWLLTRTSAPR